MGVSVSASKLYSLLRRLYMEEWVHRYYDKSVEAQHVSSAFHWGLSPQRIEDWFMKNLKTKFLRSHEAIEFFNCLTYIATDQFIDERSQIFDEFLKKNRFEES